jgi:hypothetical protein
LLRLRCVDLTGTRRAWKQSYTAVRKHQIERGEQNSLFVNLYGILIPKWRITSQELIYQDSQCPPVNRRRVTFRLDDFWSQILWRATQGIGFPLINVIKSSSINLSPLGGILSSWRLLTITKPLCKPKIYQFDMSICVQKQVLGFQVPIGHAFAFVEEFED